MISYAFEIVSGEAAAGTADVDATAGLATITLDRPDKLNALDAQALRELDAAYARAQQDGARAVLLRGAGRAFCAGRDISDVDPATDDVTGLLDGLVAPLMRRIAACPAPTFAAAHGACLGAHRTLDLVYTGRLMSGDEAVRSGLFSRAVPPDELEAVTRDAAAAAASGATAAFVASKQLVARLRDERIGLWDALAAETRAQTALRDTADYREGFAAFQQKRRPVFRGR